MGVSDNRLTGMESLGGLYTVTCNRNRLSGFRVHVSQLLNRNTEENKITRTQKETKISAPLDHHQFCLFV